MTADSALTIIRGGRVIDPANGIDEVRDVGIRDGVFVEPVHPANPVTEVIDARGLVVAPGLIDLHVHLREPGQSAKETIETGARAAAAGGFTTIVCMPNTNPSADSPETIQWINERARSACVNVFPTGAITKGLAGRELAPIESLAQAGVVALTDDGHCIQNHALMRRAVEQAKRFDLPVLDHCQDYDLVGNGVMNEGHWSCVLGLPGWPAVGEEIIVLRNILLAELCGSPIHCQHLSCAGSVRHVRAARARGIPISGEVCAHHLALTDDAVRGLDTHYKMNPPLRTEADVDALVGGIADGTITILCSDHAPHTPAEKAAEFTRAPFGILGLETEFGLFYHLLVEQRHAIALPRLIELLTVNPARLLRLDRGTLSVGKPADVTLIDPGLEWTVDANASFSLSRNTPFHGWRLKGRAVRTMVAGKTVWSV